MQIHEIQRAVAAAFNIPEQAMISPQRRREWSRPRQVAYYLCYEAAGYTLPRIAIAFNRDHSTIHYGVQLIRKLPSHPILNGVDIDKVINDIADRIANDKQAAA